jgi:hypothetical protein
VESSAAAALKQQLAAAAAAAAGGGSIAAAVGRRGTRGAQGASRGCVGVRPAAEEDKVRVCVCVAWVTAVWVCVVLLSEHSMYGMNLGGGIAVGYSNQ